MAGDEDGAVDPILQFEARPRPVGVSTVPSCGASESEYELRTQDRWRETGSNRCPCPRREVHRRNPSVALSRRSGMWGLLLEHRLLLVFSFPGARGRRCYPFGPRGPRVGNSVPPCALGEMDGWGEPVQIGAWSLAADTERADPAPWLQRQRSRTDVGLSSTTSPKSARRGCRMVTLLLAIFSLLRALGAVPIDPFDVVLRGRTSPCRSSP